MASRTMHGAPVGQTEKGGGGSRRGAHGINERHAGGDSVAEGFVHGEHAPGQGAIGQPRHAVDQSEAEGTG